jgi:hypothetical protein
MKRENQTIFINYNLHQALLTKTNRITQGKGETEKCKNATPVMEYAPEISLHSTQKI